MKKLVALICSILLYFGNQQFFDANVLQVHNEFKGTLWKMHLVDTTYSSIWFKCDSTYIEYDAEVENNFYGSFKLREDTLILEQQYRDDFHTEGEKPTKKKSSSVAKYLVQQNSTLLFLGRDGKSAEYRVLYKFKKRIDCDR